MRIPPVNSLVGSKVFYAVTDKIQFEVESAAYFEIGSALERAVRSATQLEVPANGLVVVSDKLRSCYGRGYH